MSLTGGARFTEALKGLSENDKSEIASVWARCVPATSARLASFSEGRVAELYDGGGTSEVLLQLKDLTSHDFEQLAAFFHQESLRYSSEPGVRLYGEELGLLLIGERERREADLT